MEVHLECSGFHHNLQKIKPSRGTKYMIILKLKDACEWTRGYNKSKGEKDSTRILNLICKLGILFLTSILWNRINYIRS